MQILVGINLMSKQCVFSIAVSTKIAGASFYFQWYFIKMISLFVCTNGVEGGGLVGGVDIDEFCLESKH